MRLSVTCRSAFSLFEGSESFVASFSGSAYLRLSTELVISLERVDKFRLIPHKVCAYKSRILELYLILSVSYVFASNKRNSASFSSI